MQTVPLKYIFRIIVPVPPIIFGLFAVVYYKYELGTPLVITVGNITVGLIAMRGMLLSAALGFSPLTTIIVIPIAVSIVLGLGSISQEICCLIKSR